MNDNNTIIVNDADEYLCPIVTKSVSDGHFFCQGDGCMAWRWIDIHDAANITGYCGLAGKP